MEDNNPQEDLSRNEVMDYFVKVITDTCLLKKYLLSQLPALSSQAHKPSLKMSLISAGTSLSLQILRMDMVMQQLKREYLTAESLLTDGLNVDEYLWKSVKEESVLSDAKILHHLTVLVGVEVSSFRLLESLSRVLYPRSVNQLMKLNLEEAQKNEKLLLSAHHAYLVNV